MPTNPQAVFTALEGCGECLWVVADEDGDLTPGALCPICLAAAKHHLPAHLWADFLMRFFPAEFYEPPPCNFPTPAAPGSPAKIDVMGERAEAGLRLYHDRDAEHHPLDMARTIGVLRNGRVQQQKMAVLLARFLPKPPPEPLIEPPPDRRGA